jgi:hypothetical protein
MPASENWRRKLCVRIYPGASGVIRSTQYQSEFSAIVIAALSLSCSVMVP